MRHTFLIWLSAIICATFILTGTLVYSQFTRNARDRAEQMMAVRLSDILDLLTHNERSLSHLSEANNAGAKDRARALSEIVRLNPSVLQNQEQLQEICNRLGAEQIVISDGNGVVEAAVPAQYVGYRLTSDDEMKLLRSTAVGGEAAGYEGHTSINEEMTDINNALKFSGVKRHDKPGLVRLGFRARNEQASREENSFDSPTMKLSMGKDGQIIVFRRGIRVSPGGLPITSMELLSLPKNELREIKVEGANYFTYASDGGGYRLIGVMPEAEVYASSRKAAIAVLLSNLLLFCILFVGVSYLLQRIVLRGMSKVNAALRDITEGDLEKRVKVTDSPEFTRLSNGINFMVESLRSVGEERQQAMKRGLEQARTLQRTMLPGKFPPFPDIKSFDLYATCFQANEVGGDFYDYAMPNEQRLHFLVADVDAGGIPAALYMVRAMTIIRAVARVESEPTRIVEQVNRELCEDNQSGIHMGLFYGSLDINTGMLDYVNAGKMNALIQKAQGDYQIIPFAGDVVLGENENATFTAMQMQLEPLDRIFLYTEGVLHVSNTRHVTFTEKRLQEALRSDAPSVADVLQLVRSTLRQFVEGEKIRKDITMLCMEFKGDIDSRASFTFPAGAPQEAIDLIGSRMEEIFASPLDIMDVQKSVGEVLAALPTETTVDMHFTCTEQEAEVNLLYPEPELNPLSSLASPLHVDKSSFEFTDNKSNKIVLWKKLT